MNKLFALVCALVFVHVVQACDLKKNIDRKHVVDKKRNESLIQARISVWLGLEEYARRAIAEDEAEDFTTINLDFRVAQEIEKADRAKKMRQAQENEKTLLKQSGQQGRKRPVVCFVGK